MNRRRTWYHVLILYCPFLTLCLACGLPQQEPRADPLSAGMPTIPPAEAAPATATLAPPSMAQDEVLAQLRRGLKGRGVDGDTARISLSDGPRWLQVRYASQHGSETEYFRLQMVLIAMDAAHIIVRIEPPVDGGIKVAAVPSGDSDVGMRVILIDGTDLAAWADGRLSDQEFVYEWSVGTVPRE